MESIEVDASGVQLSENNAHYSPTFSMPWVEKYRPESVEYLESDSSLKSFINSLSSNGADDSFNRACMPHIIMFGPPGTGKTSAAILIANQLYASSDLRQLRTLIINASDDRGIEIIRGTIKKFASQSNSISWMINKHKFENGQGGDTTRPGNVTSIKIVILDECDSMTPDAQAALRKLMEDNYESTRFILMCNQIQKMIPAIVSRCRPFRFTPIKPNFVARCLNRIMICENVVDNISLDVKMALVDTCNGDLRRAVNNLQYLVNSIGSQNIRERDVYRIDFRPSKSELEDVVKTIFDKTLKFRVKYEKLYALIVDGVEVIPFVRDVARCLTFMEDSVLGEMLNSANQHFDSSLCKILSHLAVVESEIILLKSSAKMAIMSIILNVEDQLSFAANVNP